MTEYAPVEHTLINAPTSLLDPNSPALAAPTLLAETGGHIQDPWPAGGAMYDDSAVRVSDDVHGSQ
jgi:hypothetical protein